MFNTRDRILTELKLIEDEGDRTIRGEVEDLMDKES